MKTGEMTTVIPTIVLLLLHAFLNGSSALSATELRHFGIGVASQVVPIVTAPSVQAGARDSAEFLWCRFDLSWHALLAILTSFLGISG
jgi:hypothetical protein